LHFSELTRVAERVEDGGALPPGDRIGLLEARPAPAQPVRGLLQIVEPQREVSARIEAEIAVRGKVHVARSGCEPEPGSVAQGLRPGDLAQAEPLRVEPAS